jgi:DNA-binding NarL/FixJ family response regulator
VGAGDGYAPGGRMMVQPRKPLTNMQQVVAESLGRLSTYSAVAKELGIAESTVRVHVHAIARLLPNPDTLAPSRVVLIWAAQRRWEKERTR